MTSPSIDQLRALLDHLDGDERSHQLAFFQGVLEAGPDAIAELDGRLPGSRAPKALRRLAMEASFYFPWPGWVPIHERILRYEPDHGIFETGVRALGRVGTAEALDALRKLHSMRQGAEFQETLAEVLSLADPQEAFNHYLGRLLQGSANAAEANEAAQRLFHLVDGSCIPALRVVAQHPDLLVFRHGLTLLAQVFTTEAAEALKEILAENHREALADRKLKEALATLRGATPAEVATTAGEALAALADAPGRGEEFQGALGNLYREALAAAQETRAGQLPVVLAQAAEGLHLRSRRLGFAVDAAAEGLADMAARGLVDGGSVLELLVPAYRDQTGREGLARAIARLVPAGAHDIHQLILQGPDGALRAAAVEVLGARLDPALEPVLLQACRDPLTDIADRARAFLGRLPDSEDLTRDLLSSPAPTDFQLGLQLVSEQRFQGMVPALLELLKTATREEMVLHLVEALGSVGSAQAAGPLLEMLHSGQNPRVQAAIAQALRGLGRPETARALCAKADEIKLPAIHLIAVEALAQAYAGPAGPVPAAGAQLLDQARRAWNDRSPWTARLRLVRALQGVELDAPSLWQELAGLVNEALGEKRPPGAWSPEDLHQVQAAAREFARRAAPGA